MGIDQLIFYVLLLLFIMEQVIYWSTGSYPYRYGFVVQRVPIPGIAIPDWEGMRQTHEKLSIKIDEKQQRVYVRYRYPFGIKGPLLFLGQVVYGSSGTLRIRAGFFSAVFLLYIIFVNPWLAGNGYHGFPLLDSLLILVLIGWLYLRFWKNIKAAIY